MAGLQELTLDRVSKHYGATRALDEVSLNVAGGEFLTLLGPSGSGKTTMLMAIAGFVAPTGGRILLNGQPIQHLPPEKRNFGMVFQGYALFPHLTVARNIAFPLEVRGGRKSEVDKLVGDALGLVQLGALADRLPRQLSGGQQQRVAIARALCNEPSLILADEPTGNLDSRTSVEIMGVFQKLNDHGITIVMVTHELDIASFTKRNIVMRDGQILSDQAVSPRLSAEEELRKLNEVHEAAHNGAPSSP